MKVLFIGNSHTFVHYVPLRVKEFCKLHGHDIEAVMLTHPGMGLDWHMQQHPTYYNLICGGYDAVVLQHNAHPFPGKDSLINAGKAVAAITPKDTKIYLYMTWSEKNNPEGQDIMSESYEELAKEIGGTICPVGNLWWKVKEAHPEKELYMEDGEHTSVLGASLSAAVIGRTLLGFDNTDPELCYNDAKELQKIKLPDGMVDLYFEDGKYIVK